MKIESILFLGFSVAPDYFQASTEEDPFPQVAAYKYETRLLEGIRSTGTNVDTLVTVATSTYPSNPNLFFPSSLNVQQDHRVKTMPVINLPLLKMSSRFVSALYYLLKWHRPNRVTCVYSAHSPYLLAALIKSLIFKTPFFIFVLDLPEFMNFRKKSWLFHSLKYFDSKLISYIFGKSTGLIVATQQMVDDFPARRNIPYLVVEGVVKDSNIKPSSNPFQAEMEGRKIILYTGSINEAHGVRLLVEGFAASSCPAELWLCGRGDLEDYLTKVTATTARVKYLGFLQPDVVAAIQSSCSLLVLTRDPAEAYTRYSFPSKLLEYLASGTPVLTTDLAGIPADLRVFLNIIEDFSIPSISKALEAFFEETVSSPLEKAQLGRNYVLDCKSAESQGKRIVEFMRSIV